MISLFNDADDLEVGTDAKLRFKDEESVIRFIRTSCQKMNLTQSRVISSSQFPSEVNPRYLLIYIIKKHSLLGWSDIGKIFNRDHTTIMAAVNKVEGIFDYHNKYPQTTTKEFEYYNFWYEYLLND